MAGIIAQAIDRDDPYSNVQGYNAAQATRKKTVAERVSEFVNGGSPMVQLSETRAKQAANKKGLLNTSMALGEAERARIETATPIAMADDQTDAQYDLSNRDAMNTSYQFTASEGNNARSQVEQGNQDLRNIGAQGIETRATDDNQGIIQSRLQSEGTAQDLTRIGATGAQTRQNIAAETSGSSQLQSESNAQQKERIAQQGQIEADLQTKRSELLKSEMFAGYTYDQLLQKVKGEQAERLTRIETENNKLMQAQQSAGQTFSTFAMSIGEILANADIPAGAKQSLVDSQIKLLENAMAIESSLAGYDLSGILDFTGTPGFVPFPTPGSTTGTTAPNSNTTTTTGGGGTTLPGGGGAQGGNGGVAEGGTEGADASGLEVLGNIDPDGSYTPQQVDAVIQALKSGQVSVADAAKYFGVTEKYILANIM
jgi:hypothetical protein